MAKLVPLDFFEWKLKALSLQQNTTFEIVKYYRHPLHIVMM